MQENDVELIRQIMIREALSNFKLSPNLTDNIMQEIEHIIVKFIITYTLGRFGFLTELD